MDDRKFEVTLRYSIKSDGEPFADYELNYHGLSYVNMQLLQKTLIEALVGLGDAGVEEGGSAQASGKVSKK